MFLPKLKFLFLSLQKRYFSKKILTKVYFKVLVEFIQRAFAKMGGKPRSVDAVKIHTTGFGNCRWALAVIYEKILVLR